MNEQNKPQATITDKAFSRLAITSIAAILFCIICLCSTTYAWFAQDVQSAENQIKAAEECLLTVSLAEQGVTRESELPVADCSQAQTYALTKGTYTVLLSLPANSASGYLVVKLGNTSYYTDFIERHTDAEPHTMEFSLVLAEDAELVFVPRWGIYSGTCNVSAGGTLTLGTPSTEGEAP